MASRTNTPAKHGVTRGKLILIGVLVVVFVAVVYWNFLRGVTSSPDKVAPVKSRAARGPSATASAPTRGRETGASTQRDLPSRGASRSHASDKDWPELELAAVVAHDPFALPEAFPHPAPPAPTATSPNVSPEAVAATQLEAANQERAATLAAIKQHGVKLVFRSGSEYVAKIGETEVRVGDKLGKHGEFRVVDISLHGVTLEGDSSP